ncbi:MAG TPA: XrtA/PEP-CTERM system TPR-repeat protein PrsT, partial [Gammaproteobacteria bacterium]
QGLEYLGRAAELAPDVAAIQTKMAIGHLLAGDTRQATDELEGAVNLGQGLWQADILLVVTYLNNGEMDKALGAAQTLQAKRPDDPMPHNLLGAVHLQRGDTDAARKAFNHALDKQPGFPPALLNLGRMDMAAGELEQARVRFQEVLAANEASLDAHYGMTDLAYLKGQRDQVERWLERARKHHPQAVKPSVLLAEHYLQGNQPLKALEVARALSEHQSSQPDALRVLGLAQMATDSNAAGVATFRRLAELRPENAQVQYLLGSAAVKQGDLNLARTAFRKVLDLEAGHAGALFSLGSLHLEAGEVEAARSYAAQLLEQQAELPWGHALQAELLAREGDQKSAAASAGEAYGRDPSRTRLLRYHQLLKDAGALEEAAELLESWLQQQPRDGAVRLRAAMELQSQGDHAAAATHYEQVLELQPGNVIALNNLAWLYLEEDPGRALRHAEQAYQSSPDRPEVLDTYGWTLVRNGQEQKGLVYLQEALLKAPHMAQIRYHTAVALQRTGRDREARLELEQALRSPEFEGRDEAVTLYESLK